MSVLFQSESSSVMWAPLGVFAAILVILAILLALPFLVSRLRQNPAVDRLIQKIIRLCGGPTVTGHAVAHLRPISCSALRSLKVSRYKQPLDQESPEADCCPICFCEYTVGQHVITLVCSHYYHQECIVKWLKRDATCPMCKTQLEPSHQGSKVELCTAGVVDGVPDSDSAAAARGQTASAATPAALPMEAAAIAAISLQLQPAVSVAAAAVAGPSASMVMPIC